MGSMHVWIDLDSMHNDGAAVHYSCCCSTLGARHVLLTSVQASAPSVRM